MSLIKALLALPFRSGTHQPSFDGVLARLRRRDLGLSLIDSRKGPLNAGVLQLTLAKVVVDSRPGGLYARARLRYLCLIIAVLQFNQQVPFVYLLIIGDGYISNYAGNFRTERGEIAANISVIGNLFDVPAFPGVPVPGNSDQDSESE